MVLPNLQLNEKIYAYYRFWNIPTVETLEHTNKDRWLLIPAQVSETRGHLHVTSVHLDSVTRSLMLIRQTGQILKIERTIPGKMLKPELLSVLSNLSIDTTTLDWPYQQMFDQTKVHERFKTRFGSNNNIMFYKSVPDCSLYRTILAQYQQARPCGSCGK
jgi:hypothetical protein